MSKKTIGFTKRGLVELDLDTKTIIMEDSKHKYKITNRKQATRRLNRIRKQTRLRVRRYRERLKFLVALGETLLTIEDLETS